MHMKRFAPYAASQQSTAHTCCKVSCKQRQACVTSYPCKHNTCLSVPAVSDTKQRSAYLSAILASSIAYCCSKIPQLVSTSSSPRCSLSLTSWTRPLGCLLMNYKFSLVGRTSCGLYCSTCSKKKCWPLLPTTCLNQFAQQCIAKATRLCQ